MFEVSDGMRDWDFSHNYILLIHLSFSGVGWIQETRDKLKEMRLTVMKSIRENKGFYVHLMNPYADGG